MPKPSALSPPLLSLKRVLVIRTGALGDVPMTTPLLTALHAAHPGVRVTWIVEQKHAETLRDNPLVFHLAPVNTDDFKPPRRLKGWPAYLRRVVTLRKRLRETAGGPFDAVIALHADDTRWLPFLLGARRRLGLHKHPISGVVRRLYTRTFGRPAHASPALDNIAHHLQTTRALGCSSDDTRMTLPQTPDEAAFLRRFEAEQGLTPGKPLVVIAPFTTWETKEWEPERWEGLMDWLHAKGAQMVVTFGPDDQEAATYLLGRVSPGTRGAARLASGTTVQEYIALIRRADLVISCDSSAMHIAAAARTPFVALFGATDPRRFAPLKPATGQALFQGVACSPCGKMTCANAVPRACMRQITLEHVTEAAERVLSTFRAPLLGGALVP